MQNWLQMPLHVEWVSYTWVSEYFLVLQVETSKTLVLNRCLKTDKTWQPFHTFKFLIFQQSLKYSSRPPPPPPQRKCLGDRYFRTYRFIVSMATCHDCYVTPQLQQLWMSDVSLLFNFSCFIQNNHKCVDYITKYMIFWFSNTCK